MTGPTRRRVLAALGLAPLLAGCGLLGGCGVLGGGDERPDPLIALADAARADALAAETLAAAEPDLAERLAPLVAARREHAAALDAEVARLDPDREPTPSPPAPTAAAPQPTLAAVGAALTASAAAATDVALGAPVERVGLVGAVTACCSAYAALLTPVEGT